MSNNKDLMGYDPLEWLREENHDNQVDATPPAQADGAISLTADGQPNSEVAAELPSKLSAEAVINFGSSLQIMDVALLKPRLMESLQTQKTIALRADDEIIIDGAGMQLLLAYVLEASAHGVILTWESLPPPISIAASLLNCEQVLLTQ